MTRRERIEFLLHNYVDVENGVQDRGFRGDDVLPRMCRAWSHPSYVELRRCIALFQDVEPVLWWDVREQFLRYEEVRVAICPRCQKEAPPHLEGELHRHGQTSVAFVARTVRRPLSRSAIRPENVTAGIGWLDQNFRGEPFIPDDLLPLAA